MDGGQLGELAAGGSARSRQGHPAAGSRRPGHQRLLRLRRQPPGSARSRRLPLRPDRQASGGAPDRRRPPPHARRRPAAGRGGVGGTDRPVRPGGSDGRPPLLRLSEEAALNLLPRPRTIDVSEQRIAWAEPAVATDASLPAEGYRLRVGPDGVVLTAADDAGAFYGRATLAQLRRLHDGALPCCSIDDWPDNRLRGVMIDISRDKVPTMATLETLVERLASWKVNQLQLYTEHTFAYAGHP